MAEAATKEPSMEDILSSIRKIIADEEASGTPVNRRVAEFQQPVEEELAVPAHEETLPVAEAKDIPFSSVAKDVTGGQMEALDPPAQNTGAEGQETDQNSAPGASGLHVETEQDSMPGDRVPSPDVEEALAVSLASIAAGIEGSEVPLPPATGEPQLVAVEESVLSSLEQEMQPVVEQELNTVMEDVSVLPQEPDVAESVMETVEPVTNPTEPAFVDMSAAVSAPGQSSASQEAPFRGALMSPSANDAVADAFDRLKRSAMDDVEAKTEAILRPMLREWLDENLPKLVENLVREEIERVARG